MDERILLMDLDARIPSVSFVTAIIRMSFKPVEYLRRIFLYTRELDGVDPKHSEYLVVLNTHMRNR